MIIDSQKHDPATEELHQRAAREGVTPASLKAPVVTADTVADAPPETEGNS